MDLTRVQPAVQRQDRLFDERPANTNAINEYNHHLHHHQDSLAAGWPGGIAGMAGWVFSSIV